MIQNLRDAELQIEAIKRAQNDLIRELRSLKLNSNGNLKETKTPTNVEIDSVLNADQNTVIHKLYHIFDRIKTRVLEVVNLTLDTLNAITVNTTNLNSTNADIANADIDIIKLNERMQFFTPYESNIDVRNEYFSYSHGAYNDIAGGNWIATHSNPSILQLRPDGLMFFYNTGVPLGPYGPSLKFAIGSNALYPNSALITDGSGAIGTPASAFSGTIYVAGSSGGIANIPKTFFNGVCTS